MAMAFVIRCGMYGVHELRRLCHGSSYCVCVCVSHTYGAPHVLHLGIALPHGPPGKGEALHHLHHRAIHLQPA